MNKLIFALIPLTVLSALMLAGCPAPAPEAAASPTPEAAPSVVSVASPEASPAASESPQGPPTPAAGKDSADSKGADVAKLGPKAVKKSDGLQYEDIKVGTGKEAKDGTSVTVHYTGYLTNGTKFDSSVDRGTPFDLTWPGQVIKGWNEGIPGMKVGGKRKLLIPPSLGYGEQGTPGGPIPPNATLVFDVQLLDVK